MKRLLFISILLFGCEKSAPPVAVDPHATTNDAVAAKEEEPTKQKGAAIVEVTKPKTSDLLMHDACRAIGQSDEPTPGEIPTHQHFEVERGRSTEVHGYLISTSPVAVYRFGNQRHRFLRGPTIVAGVKQAVKGTKFGDVVRATLMMPADSHDDTDVHFLSLGPDTHTARPFARPLLRHDVLTVYHDGKATYGEGPLELTEDEVLTIVKAYGDVSEEDALPPRVHRGKASSYWLSCSKTQFYNPHDKAARPAVDVVSGIVQNAIDREAAATLDAD